MSDKIISDLGARLLGAKVKDIDKALAETAKVVALPPRFRRLLTTIGGAVVFDKGAKYKPDKPTPMTRSDGSNSLEMLYGIGHGKDSIKKARSQFATQLPVDVVPIGEAPGGNLVCVDEAGTVLLWDHESLVNSPLWRIAGSLDHFLGKLESDESGPNDSDDVIESESFLDF